MLYSRMFLLRLPILLVCNAAVLQPGAAQTPSGAPPPKSSTPSSFLGALGKVFAETKPEDIPKVLKAVLPKAPHVGTRTIKPQLRKEAKRVVTRYGPYTLVGKGEPKPKSMMNSMDPAGQGFAELITEGICSNCTVLTGRVRVQFEDGSDATPKQGVYIHHVATYHINKPVNLPVTKCGEGQRPQALPLGSEFMNQGDDAMGSGWVLFTSADGKDNSGFFIKDKTSVFANLDLVNLEKKSKQIYLSFELEYVEGLVGSDSGSILMSVTGCDKALGTGLDLGHINLDPSGVAVTNSPKWTISKNSRIVATHAHMHDGGTEMSLQINGKDVCVSKAEYTKIDANYDTIFKMSECPENIPIKKGDILTLKSVYDLKRHPLRVGAEHTADGGTDTMGMFYITFAVDS